MAEIIMLNQDGTPIDYYYQWDTDRTIMFSGFQTYENMSVNFCNIDSEKALVVTPVITGNVMSVKVPNILLQRPKLLLVYVCYAGDESTSNTIYASRISVIPRPRPSDYIYTESEVLNYINLDSRIKALEDSNGFGGSGVYTLAEGETIDDAPAYADVVIDPYAEPEVDIPVTEADISLNVEGASVGQIVKVAAVDEAGKPTAWEAVEMPSGGDTAVTDGWTHIGDAELTGTMVPILTHNGDLITVDPKFGSIVESRVLSKPDHSAYITAYVKATDIEGQYKLVTLDGGAFSTTDDLTEYCVERRDATAIRFSEMAGYSYLKMRITAPAILFHGARTAFQIGYAQWSIPSSMSSVNKKAIEYVCETIPSNFDGYMWSKREVFAGGDFAVNAKYNAFNLVQYSAPPNEIAISHYNILLAIGTRVEMWGKR